MNRIGQDEAPTEPTDNHLEQATRWFLRMRESGRVEDLPGLKTWVDSDPLNRLAYQQVAATWATVGQFSSAPEVMVGRRDALDEARRAARRRWSVRSAPSRYLAFAASVVIAIAGAIGWLYLQRGVYTTGLGERRTLTLEDGSAVTLDARSKVYVKYDEGQRLVELERGQARFDVAKDPARPFRVQAGDQTVIALGTQFNVELVAGNVLVSLLEGKVAVTGVKPAQPPVESVRRSESQKGREPLRERPAKKTVSTPIELSAGEGIRIEQDGEAFVLPHVDVDHATAWQAGKMYFDNEPLKSAAERVNRYSQLQIIVDPAVADVGVSGVFNAGDSNAFVEAISTYFAVQIDRTSASKIHLTARH